MNTIDILRKQDQVFSLNRYLLIVGTRIIYKVRLVESIGAEAKIIEIIYTEESKIVNYAFAPNKNKLFYRTESSNWLNCLNILNGNITRVDIKYPRTMTVYNDLLYVHTGHEIQIFNLDLVLQKTVAMQHGNPIDIIPWGDLLIIIFWNSFMLFDINTLKVRGKEWRSGGGREQITSIIPYDKETLFIGLTNGQTALYNSRTEGTIMIQVNTDHTIDRFIKVDNNILAYNPMEVYILKLSGKYPDIESKVLAKGKHSYKFYEIIDNDYWLAHGRTTDLIKWSGKDLVKVPINNFTFPEISDILAVYPISPSKIKTQLYEEVLRRNMKVSLNMVRVVMKFI